MIGCLFWWCCCHISACSIQGVIFEDLNRHSHSGRRAKLSYSALWDSPTDQTTMWKSQDDWLGWVVRNGIYDAIYSLPQIAGRTPFTLPLLIIPLMWHLKVISWGLVVKNPPTNAGDTGDTGSIPGSGKASGAGNGNSLQYSCLENSTDRGVWRLTVYGVTKR